MEHRGVVNNISSWDRLPGCPSLLCHFLRLWTWERYAVSLCLTFLVSAIEAIIVTIAGIVVQNESLHAEHVDRCLRYNNSYGVLGFMMWLWWLLLLFLTHPLPPTRLPCLLPPPPSTSHLQDAELTTGSHEDSWERSGDRSHVHVTKGICRCHLSLLTAECGQKTWPSTCPLSKCAWGFNDLKSLRFGSCIKP